MELVDYTGRDDSYRAWLKLAVRREGQRKASESADKQMQPKTMRAAKAMA